VDLRLKDTVAIVTAASRGLGRTCALQLAGEGANVVVAARDAARLADVVRECENAGGEAVAVEVDLADEGACERVVDQAISHYGRLDSLVVSTPGPPSMPCEQVSDKGFRAAIEMNCVIPMRLTRLALPWMRRQSAGRVVYIGTIGVRTVQRNMVLSNASRLALLGYMKTMALEVAEDNILLNMVAPGPLETERMDELARQTAAQQAISVEAAAEQWVAEVPLRRMGKARDLATLVALLLSPTCSYTTGSVIPVDGGKASAY
jgi:3-oxoacyl-[acyl-carrier protein] reductase